MDLSKSLMYSIAAEISGLSYPSFLFIWMKSRKPPWKQAVYHDLVAVSVETRKNQLLTSGNPSFEHRREQPKSVFLFLRQAFDFQSWDTINFSTGYIHSKIINDFDKNIFHY